MLDILNLAVKLFQKCIVILCVAYAHGFAQTVTFCGQDVAIDNLPELTIVSATHGSYESRLNWNKIIEEKLIPGDAYVFVAGAYVDHPVQAQFIKDEFFQNISNTTAAPIEHSSAYGLALLLTRYTEISRHKAFYLAVEQLSEYDDLGNKDALTTYIQSNNYKGSRFLKNILQKDGVNSLLRSIRSYKLKNNSVRKYFDQMYIQEFGVVMQQLWHNTYLKKSFIEMIKNDNSALPIKNTMFTNQLIQSMTDSTYQEYINTIHQLIIMLDQAYTSDNDSDMINDLSHMLANWAKVYARLIETSTDGLYAVPKNLETNVTDYLNIHLEDGLEKKERLEYMLRLSWRNDYMVKSTVSQICTYIHHNSMRPQIFIKISPENVDEFVYKLKLALPQVIPINLE